MFKIFWKPSVRSYLGCPPGNQAIRSGCPAPYFGCPGRTDTLYVTLTYRPNSLAKAPLSYPKSKLIPEVSWWLLCMLIGSDLSLKPSFLSA